VDLSIIIVNWNSADFLKVCLQSIYREARDLSLEVIVVDNASYDGSEAMIAERFPRVRYIQSSENLGFSRANNLGFQNSTGRILFFLNPDTKIEGQALRQMVSTFDSLPETGALGCRLRNGDGTLQTSCVQSLPTVLNQFLDSEELRARFPLASLWGIAALYQPGTEPRPVEMISGAALMVRRDVFQKVGQFTADYFMYAEDADLCCKIGAAGFKLYYLPDAQIIHYGGQSSKRRGESEFSALLMQESICLYFNKTAGPFRAWLYRVSRLVAGGIRLTILAVLRLVHRSGDRNIILKNATRKWATVFRWSLGLQKMTNPGRAPAGGIANKKSETTSKEETTVVTVQVIPRTHTQ
jgi:GT2 family glycosyltransferase